MVSRIARAWLAATVCVLGGGPVARRGRAAFRSAPWPTGAAGRVPAMVIAHGGAGVDTREAA